MQMFWKKIVGLFFLYCFAGLFDLSAQTKVAPNRYRVDFTDKEHNIFSIDRPDEFLSARALQRRAKQNIAVTQADLPVSLYYLDEIKSLGIPVLNTSRWFNSAVVRCTSEQAAEIEALAFTKRITRIFQPDSIITHSREINDTSWKNSEKSESSYDASPAYYGNAATQIGMLNGEMLHQNGFRGKGIWIAVIDVGFPKVNELSGFDSVRNDGRLLLLKNFTAEANGYGTNPHGANVFSIIASNMPGQMVGSAPDATYLLIRSEETNSEYIVEEENWIAAAEFADSIGVDLITSSLGYYKFDDPSQNYTWSDLNGKSRASYAATMAAARGILVCISAGNEGGNSWGRITVPADADSVVTIGAVDKNRKYASFSSYGPTADGRIKPDLVAMGQGTSFQTQTGSIGSGSGTSYSTPLLAGFLACLWQAYPEKGNMEIIEMAKRTADRYTSPDEFYGYGIPDFSMLISSLPNETSADVLTIFPNPYTGTFTLRLAPGTYGNIKVRIFSTNGKLLFNQTYNTTGHNGYEIEIMESAKFPPNTYIVEVQTKTGRFVTKAVKI